MLFAATTLLSAQTMRGKMIDYLDNYTRTDQKIKRSTLDSLIVNNQEKTLSVYVDGGFKEQFFTDAVADAIYGDIRQMMPDSIQDYTLRVITDNHLIEHLIPNAIRRGRLSEERMWKEEYKGRPWVKNTSAVWTAPKGLEGRHIALWQSHGNYWSNDKQEWKWQRPRLFCTTEDLFTQTFVIPYIIPMLENAGAVVYDTRERNWQSNEVIVDNDVPNKDGSYEERGRWHTCDSVGFAHLKDTYYMFDNPFRDGTLRYAHTTPNEANATIDWIPDIPADGEYAVYVAYQTLNESIDDAHYTVTHQGTETHFSVNQQMGGSTWVYLGTFNFTKGQSSQNKVSLTNQSKNQGVVTADAVRFGSGMGNIARANDYIDLARAQAPQADEDEQPYIPSLYSQKTSGMPRWAEAARYTSQWAGFPDTIYNHTQSDNDYNNDLWARPETVNTLAGGSVYLPTRAGRQVPIELVMAFHSDAGFSRVGELIGSLSICTAMPAFYDGLTAAGIDRFASCDLASLLLQGLSSDLEKYDWPIRTLWNRNYCETREPGVPSVILEMLSHQNFDDLCLGYDPQFKFDFCRSVYKTIVKYLASQHRSAYVIQPLPVHKFAVTLGSHGNTANLTWDSTDDPSEPTATPTRYIVYTRIDDGGFDNGRIVGQTSCAVPLEQGHIYSFRVCAANDGGISFPSETLCAYSSPSNEGTILIVNAFTRTEGPAQISTPSAQGFDLDTDPGVPYGQFAGFCGRQLVFDKTHMGSETNNGTGFSGSELEGHIIAGNTFDYPSLHARGMANLGTHSVCSCSAEALIDGQPASGEYQMVDVIFGVQKQVPAVFNDILARYLDQGGRLLTSGNQLTQTCHIDSTNIITDHGLNTVNGSGLDFTIYRDMNSSSYAVPTVLSLHPQGDNTFAMLQYADGQPAAVVYDGNDYKTITIGFPIESICDTTARDRLMQAVTVFLCR